MEAVESKVAGLKAGRNGSGGECIKDILYELVHGVTKSDGTIRPFTYLDYRLKTDMSVEQFNKIATGEFGYNKDVKQFVRSNQNLVKYYPQNLLEEKYIIMINGELHEVTKEEKQNALDFIDDMHLPHEAKLYSLVIRATLSGDLVISNKVEEKIKQYAKKTD